MRVCVFVCVNILIDFLSSCSCVSMLKAINQLALFYIIYKIVKLELAANYALSNINHIFVYIFIYLRLRVSSSTPHNNIITTSRSKLNIRETFKLPNGKKNE